MKIGTVSGLFASVVALITPLVFGMLRPEYSHVRSYISELGESGSPYAHWVNWVCFFPIGLAVFLFLLASRKALPVHRHSLLLFSFAGWGYIVAAVFPCDPGCPNEGSTSQLIHNLEGLVGYPATTLGLMQMGIAFRGNPIYHRLWAFTAGCSVLAGVAFLLLLVPELQPWRGLTQRVAEAAIFAWIVVCSLAIQRAP